jgi:hypothetical protein
MLKSVLPAIESYVKSAKPKLCPDTMNITEIPLK